MSIYVRPVREQIEHDRVIRHLQGKLKRKHDVAANVGAEQQAAMVKTGTGLVFPDLVLTTMDRARRLAGVVEVETSESVHHLEAMAQWVPFGRLRVPFHLYVPAPCADIAKRLASDLGAHVTELWTYHVIGDQIRLALAQRTALPSNRGRGGEMRPVAVNTSKPAPPPAPAPAAAPVTAKPAAPAASKPAAAPAKAPAAAAKPAASAKSAPRAQAATTKPKAAAPKAKPAARKPAKAAKPSRSAKPARAKARSTKPAPRKTARKPAGRKPAGRVAKRR